jgi:hypothetical protein
MDLAVSYEDYPPDAAADAKAVITSLLFALKMLALYAEDHAHSKRAITRLCNELETVLSKYGELIFQIEKNRILFAGEVVHEGEAKDGDITFALFRDGVLTLRFQRGVDSEEMNELVRILHKFKTLLPEAEGDIVTALWEAQLPHIRYEATDHILEVDSEGEFSSREITLDGLARTTPWEHLDAKEAEEMLVGTKGSLEAGEAINGVPELDASSFRLTTEEARQLEEMVYEQQKRDATDEILNMMADILRGQQDEQYFDIVLQYLEVELQTALLRKNLDVSHRILVRLHQIRQLSNKSRAWARSRIDKFLLKASGPNLLGSLRDVWSTMSTSQIEKAKKVLVLLPPKAIGTLGPMLLEAGASSVRGMISDVLVSFASRDFKAFEKLLNSAEEDLVYRLVPLMGRLGDNRSGQALFKMAHHTSERVRKEAMRAVIARDLWIPEKLMSLIDDKSSAIRKVLIKYLGSRRSEAAEGLLMNYLRTQRFHKKDNEHLSACFRALGKCGSARSIPFLRDTLFKGSLISRFRGSVRRNSAAVALFELRTEKAKQILEEAARSRYRGIRNAAQAVI